MTPEDIYEQLNQNVPIDKLQKIVLGENTEKGFTGFIATYQNPNGVQRDVELWIGKEIHQLDVKVALGELEPGIHREAKRIGLQKLRFQNLLKILHDIFVDLMATGKVPVGTAMKQLIVWDSVEKEEEWDVS